MTEQPIKNIIEAALFAAGKSLMTDNFLDLFAEKRRKSIRLKCAQTKTSEVSQTSEV